MGAARGYREGSVSRTDVRRRNHVGNYCGSIDHLLVARAFRVSRIHRFIPHSAGCWNHSPGFAFRLREKGQRLKRRILFSDTVAGSGVFVGGSPAADLKSHAAPS